MNEVEQALAGTRETLARLDALLEKLDERALRQQVSSGWSVAGTLAHLAFYDDWVVERWRRWLDAGRFQDLPDDIVDLVNAAGARAWNAIRSDAAKVAAREAAHEVVELLGQLPATALDDAVATGRIAMIDRSMHWAEHLDEIESAINPTA